MLKGAGAAAVIVGHSERRQHHDETDAIVAAKAKAAQRAGLLAIICIGETKSQRLNGKALSVCGDQIAGSVPDGMTASAVAIGYEPVFCLGAKVIGSALALELIEALLTATSAAPRGTARRLAKVQALELEHPTIVS